MTNALRPGTPTVATFSARIAGGNGRDRFLVQLADGTQVPQVNLGSGITVAGATHLGAVADFTVSGTIVSVGPRTVEVLHDQQGQQVVRLPLALWQG